MRSYFGAKSCYDIPAVKMQYRQKNPALRLQDGKTVEQYQSVYSESVKICVIVPAWYSGIIILFVKNVVVMVFLLFGVNLVRIFCKFG